MNVAKFLLVELDITLELLNIGVNGLSLSIFEKNKVLARICIASGHSEVLCKIVALNIFAIF